VAAALAAGKVNLHGWVYKFESGAVSYYHGASSTWNDLG
jgi:carbonic anhydrase